MASDALVALLDTMPRETDVVTDLRLQRRQLAKQESERVATLRAERRALAKQRAQLVREEKNERKRQKRLISKTKSLDEATLVSLLAAKVNERRAANAASASAATVANSCANVSNDHTCVHISRLSCEANDHSFCRSVTNSRCYLLVAMLHLMQRPNSGDQLICVNRKFWGQARGVRRYGWWVVTEGS